MPVAYRTGESNSNRAASWKDCYERPNKQCSLFFKKKAKSKHMKSLKHLLSQYFCTASVEIALYLVCLQKYTSLLVEMRTPVTFLFWKLVLTTC